MARPDNFETIYLDSSTFLRMIKHEPGYELIDQVMKLVDERQLQMFASPMTLVEVRGQGRGSNDPRIDKQVLDILDGARLLMVEFSREVALRARDYAGRHRLKPADAVHLASAVVAEVEMFWSGDGDFGRLAGSRVDGVWVDRPYAFGPQPIPGT